MSVNSSVRCELRIIGVLECGRLPVLVELRIIGVVECGLLHNRLHLVQLCLQNDWYDTEGEG
jgi:hypothetical protein